MAFSRTVKVNLTVGPGLTPTTLETSVSHQGVTFVFDRPVPVGRFVTGEPFAVSATAFAIDAITPVSFDIEGDGHVGNGAMKNPYFTSQGPQGFDAYHGDYGAEGDSYETPYAPAANIDPAINGSIPLAAGEKASIVKSVRDATKRSANGQLATAGTYVVLTVLDEAPPVGSFRPGMAGTAKTVRSRGDVDFRPRGLAKPASWPSVASIMSAVPVNIACFTSDSEKRRSFRIDRTDPQLYSGVITPYYARFVALLNCSDVSEDERQAIIDKTVTFANDVEAVLDAGGTLGGGAGQGGGIWLWLMAAGLLLKDGAMISRALSADMQPNTPFWAAEPHVGTPASGASGVAAQTFFDEHVGMPYIVPAEWGSHHAERYASIALHIVTWEVLSILYFAQGPGDFANGFEAILQGGGNDSANADAARIQIGARWRTYANFMTGYNPTAAWKEGWDDMVAAGAVVPWTGQPDQPPMGDHPNLNDDYFAPGDGAITLDTHGIDHATEPVTRYDMRYSLDNVQWIVESDIPLSGTRHTRTGLLKGAAHWCGWRMHSGSGAGPWSANFPYALPIDSGDDRSKVTTYGSGPAAAPANAVAPEICFRPYPGWSYPYWEAAPATLEVDQIELAAGVGYWSGHPAPDLASGYSFRWMRDGADIAGATGQRYTRTAGDAGADLACEVTCTTPEGSATAVTASVTCPSLTPLPAGTLIDTTFRGAFAIDYEAELASLMGSNYAVSHVQGVAPIDQGESFGAIKFDKTGANPSGHFDLSRAAVAGTTYGVTAELAIRGDIYSGRGDFIFTIEEIGGAILFSHVTPGGDVVAGPGNDLRVAIAGTFTTASITGLRVGIHWNDPTGGTAGGDPYLTQLRIAAA